MVVDHKFSVIETFNLDFRSANLNTECLTIIHSQEVAADMAELMLLELTEQNAWHITSDYNPDGHASLSKPIKVALRRVVPNSIL